MHLHLISKSYKTDILDGCCSFWASQERLNEDDYPVVQTCV